MRAERRLAILPQREVLGQRERQHQAAEVAVLGDVRDAGLGGGADAAPGDVLPVDEHAARLRRTQSGDRLDQLVLAVAVDAGERDDLARAHRQRQAAHGLELAVVEDVSDPRP